MIHRLLAVPSAMKLMMDSQFHKVATYWRHHRRRRQSFYQQQSCFVKILILADARIRVIVNEKLDFYLTIELIYPTVSRLPLVFVCHLTGNWIKSGNRRINSWKSNAMMVKGFPLVYFTSIRTHRRLNEPMKVRSVLRSYCRYPKR